MGPVVSKYLTSTAPGGYSIKCHRERLCQTIFDRKSTPSVYLALTKGVPFCSRLLDSPVSLYTDVLFFFSFFPKTSASSRARENRADKGR